MKGGTNMKKSLLCIVMVAAVVFSMFTFVFVSEADSPTYNIPLATSAPKVDGKTGDAAWKNALTIDLSPSAVRKNGGWAQSSNNGAKGTVKVVWTEGSNGGFYFLWQIKDSTMSFAYPVGTPPINAMDCVQLCFDPMNVRKAKLTGKECQVYTFAPYTARSGNGFRIFPEDGPTWFEHYCYVAMDNSAGVKLSVSLDSKKDPAPESDSRGYLVSGYTLEAFIPFKALKVDAGQIEGKVGTKLGMGFLLVDYDWNHAKYISDNYPIAQAEKYQKLLNISATYTNGSGTTRNNICAKPKKYNDVILADASGNVPGGIEQTTNPEDSSEEPTTEAVDSSEALSKIIEAAEAIDTSLYTEESVATLTAAIEAAKKFTDEDTSDEAVAAKEALIAAYNGLELIEEPTGEEPTTENTTAQPETTEAGESASGGFKWWIIVIIVVAVAALGAVAAVVITKSKKKNSDQ